MFPRFSPDYDIRAALCALAPSAKDSVKLLEAAFCIRTGHGYALAFRYGRSGLYFLLKAMKSFPGKFAGKYVVLPSYSCVVVAHAVVEAGFTPLFLDSGKNSFQPDVQDYINIVEKHGEEIAMIIPTHLFGMTEETARLYSIVKGAYPSIFILQDCAHGFLCTDIEGDVSSKYGDGAIFGMNISKLANTVKGGIVTLNDYELAAKIKGLHQSEVTYAGPSFFQSLIARVYVVAAYIAFKPYIYWLLYWLQRKTNFLSAQTDYYNENVIALPKDYAGSMCNFEATIGLRSMGKYNQRVQSRQYIAKAYYALLAPYEKMELVTRPLSRAGYSWSHYPVLCTSSDLKRHLIKTLEKSGFEIGLIVDYSIADMACYKLLGHMPCPNASRFADLVINFPLTFAENSDLHNQSYVDRVVEKFSQAFRTSINAFQGERRFQ